MSDGGASRPPDTRAKKKGPAPKRWSPSWLRVGLPVLARVRRVPPEGFSRRPSPSLRTHSGVARFHPACSHEELRLGSGALPVESSHSRQAPCPSLTDRPVKRIASRWFVAALPGPGPSRPSLPRSEDRCSAAALGTPVLPVPSDRLVWSPRVRISTRCPDPKILWRSFRSCDPRLPAEIGTSVSLPRRARAVRPDHNFNMSRIGLVSKRLKDVFACG